jgi:hypothetical protein
MGTRAMISDTARRFVIHERFGDRLEPQVTRALWST